MTRQFHDTTVDPPVRGFLHTPETPMGKGIVLTHGAGSNAQAPLLIALAEVFCANGFTVLRCDLPYRQRRSFGPPGPSDAARDRAGLKNAIAALKKGLGGGDSQKTEKTRDAPLLAGFARIGNTEAGSSIFLSGHSYGGRQSSMLCAEEPDLVGGLMLNSYPLHPPGKREQQRTQHLPDLRTPTLFVHGTRDAFGSIEELQQAMKMIPAKTKLMIVEGAGHDLGFKGKKQELPARVFSEFTEFFALSS